MANPILPAVYRKVYETDFSPYDFSQRVKMQKLVYLLQEAGITLGDYSFFWYKHGPYCQKLQEDILNSVDNNIEINYSENALQIISTLKELFFTKTDYNQTQWVECLASLHYLFSNVFSYDVEPSEIIAKLEKIKPHLNNTKVNNYAFQKIKEIFK